MKSSLIPLTILFFVILASALLASAAQSPECDEARVNQLLSKAVVDGEGDPALMVEAADQVVASCPNSAEAHLARGIALESSGDLDGAVAEYRLSSDLDPDSALPLARLAHVARLRGDVVAYEVYLDSAEALELTERDRLEILRAAAEDPPSETGEGYSFKVSGQIEEGLQVGSKSIRPKSVSDDYGSDYFVGSKGFGVNLGILFEVGSIDLKPEGRRQLDELGRALQRASVGERYLIEGHASSEGDPVFNETLSERRAQAIAQSLVDDFGLGSEQLEFVGRGTKFPVMENDQENRIKSRRVTVLRLYDE